MRRSLPRRVPAPGHASAPRPTPDPGRVPMRRIPRASALPALALLALLTAAAPAPAAPDGEAEWLRYPAISPDRTKIAFSYRGDLWVVPTSGGDARPLTTHVATERMPVWSPDGTTIAFQSDRHGNFDVFVMPAAGGPAERLTWHSSQDAPSCFTPDGSAVVFTSARLDAPQSAVTSAWLPELYAVPVKGGRARMLLTTTAERAVFSKDGASVLYQDRKGYENEWRKHHTSSVARDVWLWRTATGEHVKLTSFAGEDRNPVWAGDSTSFLYLSEAGGSFNVWRRGTAPDAKPEQVTTHTGDPVRFLSAADDGTLCYAFDGGLWVRRPADKEATRIPVRCAADDRTNALLRETKSDGATEFAPAPSGEEIAFILRGDVWVCSAKHGTTRRITNTPTMERSLSWAPDGRAIWYAAERSGSWDVVRTVLVKAGEERLVHATELREETMLGTPAEEFQPLVSPDGAKVAFLLERDRIAIAEVATKAVREIVPAERNYSYVDGDLQFAWSPDSRKLAFTWMSRSRWLGDIGVADVGDGSVVNVTDSGYEEEAPRWTADGRALCFLSDRLGRRAHGSWGSDTDLFAFDLTRDAHARAGLSMEDFEILKKEEDKAKPPEKKDDSAKPATPPVPAPPPAVDVEWQGRDRRVRRLTLRSAPIGGWAVSPDGETVVYWAQVEHSWDVWAARPRRGDDHRIAEFHAGGGGGVVFQADGKSVWVSTPEGKFVKLTLSGLDGDGPPTAAREDSPYAAELRVDLAAERAGMFEHAWRQAKAKFYRPDMHGADWARLHDAYARFLPHVTTGADFAELLSEMLGELNASHTGAGWRPDTKEADETASLGLLYDTAASGDGLVVAEVLAGGPFDRASSKIVAGAVIVSIDGEPLTATTDPARLLDRKAGKHVVVAARVAGGEVVVERIRAIGPGDEAALRYRRWTDRCAATVARISGGRVGYVHVAGMNEDGFRTLYRDALGRSSDCEALVVDTRWNGGGWLHDDLVGFLGGKDYLWFVPRGKSRGQMGTEPARRWTRPVAVLMNEGNYSDAHVFPYAFRALGLGKLVGAPVAGTGTAVWWERQVDGATVFGIPQVGLVTKDGSYLENSELTPDVLVLPDPADLAKGEDRQLAEAVRVALEEADAARK